jgi:hypothetical protein
VDDGDAFAVQDVERREHLPDLLKSLSAPLVYLLYEATIELTFQVFFLVPARPT